MFKVSGFQFLVSKALLFALLLSSCVVYGQHAAYSTKNSNAIRMFESARRLYDEHQDKKAIEDANDAIKLDSIFVEPYLLLANIYTDDKNPDKAKEYYRKAVAINPDFFPKALYTLGKMEFASAEYEQAQQHLEKFITYPQMTKPLVEDAKRVIENCVFAEYAVKHPVPFTPINMGDSINTKYDEYFPAITADGSTFLFTRRLPATKYGLPGLQEDFYVSHLINGKWSEAVPLDEINTSGNEGAPSLSADGMHLFFTLCPEAYGYPGNRNGYGSCDLFIANKVGDKWANVRNLGPTVNTGAWESQPSFSSDGRTLYFS